VGKSSDHLKLIKFWPSCAPGKGVCGGAKIFGSALLQPARSVCVSLIAFFITNVYCVMHPWPYCNGRNRKTVMMMMMMMMMMMILPYLDLSPAILPRVMNRVQSVFLSRVSMR